MPRKHQSDVRANRCSVCGGRAEVAHPDGYGDQTYYCGFCEPETLLNLIDDNGGESDAEE